MADLDAKAICAIIKACRQSDVKELKVGEMCVTFSSRQPEQPNTFVPTEIGTVHLQDTEISSEDLKPQTLMSVDQREAMRQIEETQMMIDDPVGFEIAMIDSERTLPREPSSLEAEGMNA